MSFLKKQISFLFLIIISFLYAAVISSCGSSQNNSESKTENAPISTSTKSTNSITEFQKVSYNKYQSIRMTNLKNPDSRIIRSLSELEALVESRQYESHGPGTTFDLFDKYDKAFFNENSLVILELENGSGSTVIRIDDASSKNNIIYINGTATNDYPITQDMAYWVFSIEFDKDDIVDINDIAVNMTSETINTSGLK